ncbi:MAG: hypothetical protein GYB20_13515 [Oceanospirillales bacterium]|nr:hypothetical protein [Oceanospirillales bacterium]MBR9888697.1 hypothetical protein [Oceanospirillales bacterium]
MLLQILKLEIVSFLLIILLTALPSLNSQAAECGECHMQQVSDWQQSQHALSMALATTDSVLGNFNQTYRSEDVEAVFFLDSDIYKVRLTEQGKEQVWVIKYVFGNYPLQQYLIETGNGRLQALNIAWDSRSKEDGGQNWFRLDQPDHQDPGQPLHWKGIYQNWNTMCADCHSTELSKGYSLKDNQFSTHFKTVNVSCAACHENADTHALAARSGKSVAAGQNLKSDGAWLTGNLSTPPVHTGAVSSPEQTEMCGRCHSLRTRLDPTKSGKINDQYSLNRLFSPLYFEDGRVKEEVFILGSFLQSKMHNAGVVCSNCHNPHSAKLKIEGNALCGQCHALESFDRPEHHQHMSNSEGSQCVNCHMPTRTYMQIDQRREHNFTTPNPFVAAQAGSPDPCLACHKDKDNIWSRDQVGRLWPTQKKHSDWFDIQRAPIAAMREFIENREQPSIYRATLLEQQAASLAFNNPETILAQLSSPSALIRESSWKAAVNIPKNKLDNYVTKGLSDKHLSVRLAAYETLLIKQALPADFTSVKQEYIAYLEQIADRPAGRTMLARYKILTDNTASSAGEDLAFALDQDPQYLPAVFMLTELLRNQKRFSEAVTLLTKTLELIPQDANLLHLRGLTQLQLKQINPALTDLRAAYKLAPENISFGYRLAQALKYTHHLSEAEQVIQQLKDRFPQHPAINSL